MELSFSSSLLNRTSESVSRIWSDVTSCCSFPSMAMDNDIPVIVFALADPENISRVLHGEKIGTLVHS